MKKKMLFTFGIITVLFLAACGSKEVETNKNKKEKEMVVDTVDATNKDKDSTSDIQTEDSSKVEEEVDSNVPSEDETTPVSNIVPSFDDKVWLGQLDGYSYSVGLHFIDATHGTLNYNVNEDKSQSSVEHILDAPFTFDGTTGVFTIPQNFADQYSVPTGQFTVQNGVMEFSIYRFTVTLQ